MAINAADGEIAYFTAGNTTTDLLKTKEEITDQTDNNCRKNVEVMVPLKYLSNFWKILEMPLISCEISPDLN